MLKQMCRACGNEVYSHGSLPLEFCTNCGARMLPQTQNNVPSYATVPFRRGAGSAKLTGKEKLVLGILVSIPVFLILAGIGAVGLVIYGVSQRQAELNRYSTPRPYASPSPQKEKTNALLSFGREGLGQGEFKNAEGLAVDKEGNIYVGDGTLRIQKFDSTGKFLQLWNVTEGTIKPDEKYSNAVSNLVVDSKNRLYVAVARKELFRYDAATGKFIDKIPLYGEKWMNRQQEAYIMDMVLLNDDNLVILASSFPEGEYIMTVSPEGKTAIKHKDLMKKQGADRMRLSNGSLLVSVTGEMFVMDNMVVGDKSYIYRFKPDGSYVDRFTWNGAPSTPVFFNKVIALNSKGEIYAHDSGKAQLNVLNVEGVPQRTIPLTATYFKKMVLDATDNIFVLTQNKVEKFSSAGS
jgi:hypothetical protein